MEELDNFALLCIKHENMSINTAPEEICTCDRKPSRGVEIKGKNVYKGSAGAAMIKRGGTFSTLGNF